MEDIAIEWNNKEILFPDTFYFSKTLYDTINYDINTPFKVFYYVDSTGCSSCKLKINGWYELQYLFDDLFHGNCKSVIVFEPKNAIQILEISTQIHVSGTDNCYILDTCGLFNKLNNFPDDERFHCFLLDENNKVILIGNPVLNSKIKDLYLKTISERLGIDCNSLSSHDSSLEFDFGTFTLSEDKSVKFVVSNHTKSVMPIDTISTSCKCTTASIDKYVIHPSGSAVLTVNYTPDEVGEFYREVYVHIKGEETPLIYTIRGKVE